MQQNNALSTSSLAFSLQNDQQKPVIYITRDPSLNQLTFTLANAGSSTLQLVGGTPIAEPDRQAGSPTSLYLTLGSLLTTAEFKNAHFVAVGWQATYFTAGGIINWGLTPVSDITLRAGDTISFTLTNLTATERPGSGFLTVDYYGIGFLPAGTNQVKVFLQNPPVVGRKELRINAAFSGSNEVIVTENSCQPVGNKLSFYLANPDPTHPIVSTGTPWETNPPVFILSFVEGKPPGYGALTTAADAAGITVDQKSTTGTLWQVQPVPATDNPTWHLLPQNHEVLGIGAESTMDFEIDNIISQLEPGLTSMYLQYANLPGYNDGFLSLIIQKEVPARIVSFFASPGVVMADAVPAQVSLQWEVKNATSLEVRSGTFGSVDVTGRRSWKVPKPLQNSQVFTLHAIGSNSTFRDQTVNFEVIDFKINLKPTVPVLPATNSFQNAAYSKKGAFAYFIGPRGNFAAVNTKTNAVVQHNFGTKYAQALVTSPEIDPNFDRLYFYDGLAYELYVVNVDGNGNPTVIKRLKTPQYSGSALVVSPDGQKVYFQNGSNSIGMFQITDYVQQALGAWQIDSSDYRDMVISSDGNTLYVSTGGDMVQQFDIPSQKTVAQAKIGKGYSWNMAITPDNKQVYIANYYGGTVTVMFPEEKLRTEVITVGPHPFAVAVSPDGLLAYALIADTDTIAVIDTMTHKVIENLEIMKVTQGGLVGIAVSPDGEKLYLIDNSFNFSIAEVKVTIV